MVIWKFPFVPLAGGVTTIRMPEGAEILHLALQYRLPTLWATVDPSAPREDRLFLTCSTGGTRVSGDYIGTWMEADDALVWHLFQITL